MAFISRCILEKLAGRGDTLNLTLNRNVNVFFGANGSGKTSLLRALHSALSNDSKGLAKIPIESALISIEEVEIEHPEWIVEEQTITRTIQIQPRSLLEEGAALLGEKPPRRVWSSSSDVEDSTDAGQSIDHVYLPITRLYATEDHRMSSALRRRIEGAGHFSESDLDSVFTEAVNLLWLRYTRNLLADIRSAQEAGLNSILYFVLLPENSQTDAPQVEDPHRAYVRLSSFINRQAMFIPDVEDEEEFNRRLKTNGLMRNVVEQIEQVELRVERAQRPRDEFEKLLEQMIGGGKSLQLADRDIHVETADGHELSISSLSSGEKQLLRICVEALFAGNNPIIIDEPELSMHIDWQRRLVKALRLISPSSQLIIATHSPEIMAELSEEFIFEI